MSYQDASRNIGQSLIHTAHQKRIKQSALAGHMGVTESAVSKIFNGKRGVSLADFLALCDAVDVSPSEALQWVDGPPVPEEVEIRGRKYRLVS